MKRIYDIMVVVALVAATFFYLPSEGATSSKREIRREVKKYRQFLKLLDQYHIDTLNYQEITESAICGALDMCDPHSRYLPKVGSMMLREEIESTPLERSYMVDSTTLCIKVSLFARNTSEMILSRYREMGSPNRLILDLRGNHGGLVEEAIKTAKLFLTAGDLILTRMGRGAPKREFFAKNDGLLKVIELIVVIDHETASASEILVGALKDHNRAAVVGEKSFGKGLIMKQYNLQDSSSVLIAIAKYLTPNSHSIQSRYSRRYVDLTTGGITPTVVGEYGKTIDIEDIKGIYENFNKK